MALLFVVASLPVGLRLANPGAAAAEQAAEAETAETSGQVATESRQAEESEGLNNAEGDEGAGAVINSGFVSSFFSGDGVIPRVLLPVHIVLSGLMMLVGPF